MLYRMEILELLNPFPQSITEKGAIRQHKMADIRKVASR